MRERYENAARELLPAIGYGDAAGLPVETKNAAYISEHHGYITKLKPPLENPFYKGEWEAGSTSDDTQLSRVVAESIIEQSGFLLDDQACYHMQAYYETPRVQKGDKVVVRGWGGSTTHSMERLAAGTSPEYSGEKDGAGNGIIMKMAPLAIWQTMADVDDSSRSRQYDALTTMTHDSDIARLCTRVHGAVLSRVLETGDLQTITDTVHGQLADISDFPGETSLLHRAVDEPCQSFDELVARYAAGNSGFKYGFYVPETLAIVYDIALGSEGDFETAVYRAVNLGGDADSTASIVASMVAFSSEGEYTRPQDMYKVHDIDQLYAVSEQLSRVVRNGE